MSLRSRLLYMAISLVVGVTLASLLVVYLVVGRQSRAGAEQAIAQSFKVIQEELAAKKAALAAGARQLAVANKMPVNLKYLAEYNRISKEPEIRNTYTDVLREVATLAAANDLWRVTIRDSAGNLIAFLESQGGGQLLGYSHFKPAYMVRSGRGAKGEELKPDSWKQSGAPPAGLAAALQGPLPDKASLGFALQGGLVCLAAREPVMAQVYDRKAQKMVRRQVGLVEAVSRLDKSFPAKMARLTGREINVFGGSDLSVGTIPAYGKLQQGRDQVTVGGQGYYQGTWPIPGDKGQLGVIASLYSQKTAQANARQMLQLLVLASLACIALAWPVVLFLSGLLSRPINQAVGQLDQMAEQVALAAGEVSRASQALAEGASRQAAALEEASASLEEIAGRTRQGAQGAREADQLAGASRQSLQEANVSMKGLMNSLQETNAAGDNVAKVIKTIDNIAFQTNLLALNAAVEAARAGQAGAGFAVVAGEVRNLAAGSARASATTRQLVQDIVQKVAAGSGMVTETDEHYARVARGVAKVADLVKTIVSASDEQLDGIGQIKNAVREVSGVVQGSAASSQQAAAASEQMSAQAEQMKRHVETIRLLIGGKRSGRAQKS